MLAIRPKYYRKSENFTADHIAGYRVSSRFHRINQIHSWIIIPLLGIALPRLSGLVKPGMFSFPFSLLQDLLFIAIAEVIYRGNMFFLYKIRFRNDLTKMSYGKIVVNYFLINIVYSGLVALASLSTWNVYVAGGAPFARSVSIATLLIIISVLFINNLYEIFYLRSEVLSAVEKMETIEKAKNKAELESLNNQIDPHFLYNALTSLSYLIQLKPWEADKHNARLVDLYSYVLNSKCLHFVTLKEEIAFCKTYFEVQQLRFGNAVGLQVIPGNLCLEQYMIPPLAIQLLIENALKHNRHSETEPLLITVWISQNEVCVTNKVQQLHYAVNSSGVGLANLQQRLKLLTGNMLKIENTNDYFKVSVPVESA